MAKPDLKNGHFIQLSHEILERLIQCKLNSGELRTALYVLRLTYGFKRKEAQISSAELCDQLEVDSSNVRKILSSLCERGIIVKIASHKGVIPPTYGFNKDWEKWTTGRKTPWPNLLASRVSRYPTKESYSGVQLPDKQAQDTRLTGTSYPTNRHQLPDYVSKDSEQNDAAPCGIKNKEQRINNPLTPDEKAGGGEEVSSTLRDRVRDAMTKNGWTPSRRELNKATDMIQAPTPSGWDKSAWRKHLFRLLMSLVDEVKAEMIAGQPVYSPIALACERLRVKLQIDAMLPPKAS